MKENCLLIFLNAPSADKMPAQLKNAFGAEKAVLAYTDMARHLFAASKKLSGVQPTIIYKGDSKYPDLRWLDPDDPGFLNLKGTEPLEQFTNAMGWAFDAGAVRATVLSVQAPGVPPDWLEKTFSLLTEKDIVLGPAQDGECYLLGMTRIQPAVIEGYPWPGRRFCDELAERAKRLRMSVYLLPEFPLIKEEKAYQQWISSGRKPAAAPETGQEPPRHKETKSEAGKR